MMCGPCGCGNDECGSCIPLTCASVGRVCGTMSDGCGGTIDCGTCPTPPQPITFECITNQDCEPTEFNPDEIGKFFICNDQYRCTNQTAEDIESIVCSINEECPYGYECYEGSCWGFE